MLFGNKDNKNGSRCAFGFYDDGICFVLMSQTKGSKPHVEAIEFCAGEPGLHPLLIKQLLKSHKLKKMGCTTFIDNQFYQLLVTDKPEVPDEDLINALHWEIKDLLTLPIQDVTLDTFYVPDYGTGKKSINIVSAQKEKITDIAKKFDDAKLNLENIIIEEFAIRNLAVMHSLEKLGMVTLWLNANYGKIIFFSGENIHLTRNIDMGYNTIANSIDGMEMIALEVQRSLDYFERHYNQIPISNLLLMPLGLESTGFIDFLKSNLSIPCHEYLIKEELTGLDDLEPEKISKFLLTIGAGIHHEEERK